MRSNSESASTHDFYVKFNANTLKSSWYNTN